MYSSATKKAIYPFFFGKFCYHSLQCFDTRDKAQPLPSMWAHNLPEGFKVKVPTVC